MGSMGCHYILVMYRLTHGSWGITGYTGGGQLYTTPGPKGAMI